jgi:hypothetical protein
MPAPQMKSEIAISSIAAGSRVISFNCSPSMLIKMKNFGHITMNNPGFYSIIVDARYEFNEVLEYIRDGCKDE